MSVAYPSPAVALASFIQAAQAGDEQVARAASCPASWDRRGESALKAFAHLREGFRMNELTEPVVEGDRAVAPVSVFHPSEPMRRSKRFALIERIESSWGLGAVVESEVQAALFLRGDLPALFEVEDLPEDPEVSAWALRAAATLREQALLTVGELGEVAQAPVLGALPRWAEDGAKAFDALPDDHEVVLAYGELARRLLEADHGGAMAFASSTSFEGASQVVVHLGQVLAGLAQRTLLIDLDFDRPSLHLVTGSFQPAPGVSDAMIDGTDLGSGVRSLGEGLDLLPAGRPEQPPGDGFARFAEWLTSAREDYDQILVLIPRQGLASVASGLSFSPLLVAHAGAVPAAAVDATRRGLQAEGVELAGVVATRLDPSSVPDPALDLEALRRFAEGEPQQVTALGSFGLPRIGRAFGGLSMVSVHGGEVEAWTLFDTSGASISPIRTVTSPSVDQLLGGIDARLPAAARGGPKPADVAEALGTLFVGLGESLRGLDLSELDRAPARAADAVARGLEKAGKTEEAAELRRKVAQAERSSGDPEGLYEAPQGASASSSSDKAEPLERNLTEAVRRFAEQRGDGRSPEELLQDPEFMKEHGGAFAREMFGSILGAVLPPSDTSNPKTPADRPDPSPDGAKDPGQKLRADLGGFLRKLVEAADKAQAPSDD
ncbi:MAG: hypothetical protein EA397_19860 [Deltaproteobacteria bacterium]|nr:MAG: hypothetical protein EA397_19860 [Deltaproteobacteria bacterium]